MYSLPTASSIPGRSFRLLTPNPLYRFEAFDEPWKVQFNTPGKEWEDKWGLMDSARKLKKGLKIPDCDGKTAP